MNIHIALYAYTLADDLIHAFQSINQDNVTCHLFLHSTRLDVIQACEYIAGHPNVIYYPYGENRGCAKAINQALMAAQDNGADVVLTWPDDLTAQPSDIDRMAQTVLAHPECSIVESMGWVERTGRVEHLRMNGAALNLRAVERIGYFDENLSPVYFDDTDWLYRARLAGMPIVTAQGTYYTHAGSKTLITPDLQVQFAEIFERNKAYYISKWGGDGGREQFDRPFNNPFNTIKIERTCVHNPYSTQWIENVMP